MILIPYSDFCKINAALTKQDKRKMVNESYNLLLAGGGHLWDRHLYTLARYGHTLSDYSDNRFHRFLTDLPTCSVPEFLFDANIHKSHRLYLIKQNPYYLSVWPYTKP